MKFIIRWKGMLYSTSKSLYSISKGKKRELYPSGTSSCFNLALYSPSCDSRHYAKYINSDRVHNWRSVLLRDGSCLSKQNVMKEKYIRLWHIHYRSSKVMPTWEGQLPHLFQSSKKNNLKVARVYEKKSYLCED